MATRYWTLPDGTRLNLDNQADWMFFFNYCAQHPEDLANNQLLELYKSISPNIGKWFAEWSAEQKAYQNIHDGSNPNDVNFELGSQGITPNATNETAISNAMEQYNTQQAQDFSNYQMNNQYLSAGAQLTQLGLSPSGVLQTGGAVGNGVAAANVHKSSGASLKNQQMINTYNNKMSMAKSLIGMVGQMASSGIYGSAIGAAKHSAATLAGATAHSAYKALGAASKLKTSITDADVDSFWKGTWKP